MSPAALSFVQGLSSHLAAAGGAALLIDYGSDAPPSDSLRGIRGHRFVHPLHAPGEADLSVDVDFRAVRAAATATDAALVCPPMVEQRHFLAAMGLEARVNALLRAAPSDEVRQALFDGATRLVESPGMGSAYKALAIAHPSMGGGIPGFVGQPSSSVTS